MAKMTAYHDGYTPVKHPKYEQEETQKILVQDFIVQL